MKKLLTNNIGMKIASIAIAIVIWMVIMSLVDPVITNRFTLNVDIINADSLEDQEKTYEIVSGSSITVTVKGKTSIVQNMKAADLTAVADMSKLSITNAVPIEVTCAKYGNQIDIDTGNAVMNVDIENVVSKDFKIKFETTGNAAEGYYAGDIVGIPNIISVTGSETKIEQIKEAVVSVNLNGASTDIAITGAIILRDADGNEISQDNLKVSNDHVDVTVSMLKTKTVDMVLAFEGEPAEGYIVTGTSYSPKEMLIAGKAYEVRSIDKINLTPYDLTGISENLSTTISIADDLPSGVRLVDASADDAIAITINVEKLVEKKFIISISDLKLTGSDSKYNYRLADEGTAEITVSGPESVVDDIRLRDITLTADVTGLTEGSYNVEVNMSADEELLLSMKKTLLYLTITDNAEGE